MNPTCEIEMLRNGADVGAIEWRSEGNGRAICLGRIGRRKRQARIAETEWDWGPIADGCLAAFERWLAPEGKPQSPASFRIGEGRRSLTWVALRCKHDARKMRR